MPLKGYDVLLRWATKLRFLGLLAAFEVCSVAISILV